MSKKYIFFDIDGTLTSHKTKDLIFESTLEALRLLQENGHFVCLATGRAHFRAMLFADRIGLGNVVSEGGRHLTLSFEEVSYEYPDQEVLKDWMHRCDEHGLAWCVSTDDNRLRQCRHLDKCMEKVGPTPYFMEVEQKEFDIDELEGIRRFFVQTDMPFLRSLPPHDGLGLMGYEWSPFFCVEPDDKYAGILKMTEMVGGKEEDIVVVGDGLNDISMFKKAPFGIAMGNACDEVKAEADYITDDAEHDGIYNACKHFGWI